MLRSSWSKQLCPGASLRHVQARAFDGVNNLLLHPVLPYQVPECVDRGLIKHPITVDLDAGKAPHGGHLNQGRIHGRLTE